MKILFWICLNYFLLFHESNSAPTVSSNQDEKEVLRYLRLFGYLPDRNRNSVKISRKKFHHALRRLQRFASIPETGEIDDTTLEVIKRPRCGVPDIIRRRHREKRYELLSDKWPEHTLTWFFDHKNGRFQRDSSKIRSVIAETLSVWEKSSVLKFVEGNKKDAEILISFEKPYHPEVDPYQMSSDVLAHAFGPGDDIGGDAHFKLNILWDFDSLYEEKPSDGYVSFFAVALHELGHSLGLSHSSNPEAVMYFSYSTSTGVLSDDDVKGIQHIYGVPEKYQTKPNISPETTTWIMDNSWPDKPNECNTSYDAITSIKKEIFIFKGIYYWRPDRKERDAKEMRHTWRELPENMTHVDAVFENFGEIFFFIGRNVYVFNDNKFSHVTTLGALGIDHHFSKVDAVFKWHFNDRIFIFSGDQYWRWDEEKVNKHYPKDISRAFTDVYNYDTAFSDDEKLYFFKGTDYYEFDHITMRLNRMHPLPSAQNFMKCNGSKIHFKVANRFGEEEKVDFIDVTQSPKRIEEKCNIEKNSDDITCPLDIPKDKPTVCPPGTASSQFIVLPILLGALVASQALPNLLLLF